MLFSMKSEKFPLKNTFLSPESYRLLRYLGFSDAAQGKSPYSQTGYISGITFKFDEHHVFHDNDWQR